MTVPAICRGSKIIHRLYGRGVVKRLHQAVGHLKVRFDGEPVDRRVVAGDCEREPSAMPENVVPMVPRYVYPPERAGQPVAVA